VLVVVAAVAVGCGGQGAGDGTRGDIAFLAPPAGATGADAVFGGDISALYVVRMDGLEPRRLTDHGGFLMDKEYFRGLWDRPVWSPDGSRVAASCRSEFDEEGNWLDEDEMAFEIWVTDATGDASKLVDDGIAPTWSPAGSSVAYMQYTGGESGRLAVVDADGTNKRVLVDAAELPRWSPAGDEILYWAPDPPGIRVVSIDGGEPRLVHRGWYHADWAPDGKQIAYVGEHGLHVSDANGRNPRTLSNLDVGGFAWSPDGSRIAFVEITYDHDWAGDLYVVPTDGGQATKILSDVVGFPSWAPDDSRLAVAKLETPDEIVRLNRVQIATLDTEGTNLELVTNGNFDLHPAWQPAAPDDDL